jgi:HSP20 family protein
MAETAVAPKPAAPAPAPAPRAHFDPFAAFRSEMDRLFDSFFGGARAPAVPRAFEPAAWFGGALSPSVDVAETDAALTLTAELPGMAAGDVELAMRGGTLTLKGEKKSETERKEGEMHVSERRYGAFQRSFALPEGVDADRATAKFENGVLTVTLPKKPEAAAAARRIPIG